MTPRTSTSDVCVVVVTYNSASVVADLLDSLPNGLAPFSADVVVVDNDSTDGTRELVAARPECRLIPSENLGYAAAINLGVAESAPAPAILILNPDTLVHPGALTAMMPVLGDPLVGVVAPRTVDTTGALMLTQRREPTLLRATGLSWTGAAALSEHVSDPAAYELQSTVDWAVGAALLVSRQCHDLLGGWDPSFFLYSEETDFCLRARDLGFSTVYVPGAVVTHDAGGSGRTAKTHSMQVINRVRLYRRRHGPVSSSAYFTAVLFGELARLARGGGAASRRAVRDLVHPARRPAEMHASARLLPR
jgi:GT2 family glycosyltransferase